MKLYCVKFKNVDFDIIDVMHIFANNNTEVHKRLDEFLEQCKKHGLDSYYCYAFYEVQVVDGIDVSRGFERFKIDGNRIVLK